MTEQTVQNQIDSALDCYNLKLELDHTSISKVTDVLYDTAKMAATELLKIAKLIRSIEDSELTYHPTPGWRQVGYAMEEMLAVGQAYSRILFSCNLRDQITDYICHFYGINFSGLKAYPKVIRKIDGLVAYQVNPAQCAGNLVMAATVRPVGSDKLFDSITVSDEDYKEKWELLYKPKKEQNGTK